MLLDLWGRGYSDSSDLPHDSRLYTTEILLALTSSPLSWTPEGFNIIGYSLGGGIAADFAAYFPKLVKGLALLAPAGLMRPYHLGYFSKLVYNGLIPQRILEVSIRRKLTGGPEGSNSVEKLRGKKPVENAATGAANAVVAEVTGESNPHFNSVPLNKDKPNLTVASAVKVRASINCSACTCFNFEFFEKDWDNQKYCLGKFRRIKKFGFIFSEAFSNNIHRCPKFFF